LQPEQLTSAHSSCQGKLDNRGERVASKLGANISDLLKREDFDLAFLNLWRLLRGSDVVGEGAAPNRRRQYKAQKSVRLSYSACGQAGCEQDAVPLPYGFRLKFLQLEGPEMRDDLPLGELAIALDRLR
jgi:hypothetical protein